MKEARVRIGKVTFKASNLAVLRNEKSEDYSVIMANVAKVADMIPSILVPDFVRNRLLAERIEQWTLDTINNR